jgi:hypothetical protein
MSVLIEALTLVMRRSTLDASFPGGADAMMEWLASEEVDARWVVTDEHLVAASFFTATLHPVMDTLLDRGFFLTEEEGNPDAVVVDALLGLPAFCAWLEWERPPRGELFSICWLAGTAPGKMAIPDGHTPGEDAPLRAHTRWAPDMIRLGREESSELWLNTRTGQVEVHAPESTLSEPGPIMAGILGGLPTTVQEVRITDGDAEEAFGTFLLGPLCCTLRVRTYEAQSRMEAALLLPFEIPSAHLDQMEVLVREVREREEIWDARIDAATAAPCGFLGALLDEIPTPPLMLQMMDILETSATALMYRMHEVAEEDSRGEFAWLRVALGIDEASQQASLDRELSELLLDLAEAGWARVRVRDLMKWFGADNLTDDVRERIGASLGAAGLDPSGVRRASESDWMVFTREPGESVGRSWATEG